MNDKLCSEVTASCSSAFQGKRVNVVATWIRAVVTVQYTLLIVLIYISLLPADNKNWPRNPIGCDRPLQVRDGSLNIYFYKWKCECNTNTIIYILHRTTMLLILFHISSARFTSFNFFWHVLLMNNCWNLIITSHHAGQNCQWKRDLTFWFCFYPAGLHWHAHSLI